MPRKIFFTSDHHFGHRGIIQMSDRSFLTVDDMDEELIKRWNERVRGSDIVYHLGDLTMGASAERGAEIFKRLRGRKHLIVGNHDALKVRSLSWASEPRGRLLLRHPGERLPLVLDHYALRTWPVSITVPCTCTGTAMATCPASGAASTSGSACGTTAPSRSRSSVRRWTGSR